MKGRLFILSGPSGVGKGTIVNEIMKTEHPYFLSVSMTTRDPREGDVDGVNYHFRTEEVFLHHIDQDGFLEYAQVHGNYYGTPKEPVLRHLEQGTDVILEIDVQGAMKVLETLDRMREEGRDYSCTTIFILPPSIEELRKRIIGRGTDDMATIEHRMQNALGEIRMLPEYDYYVVNDDLQKAIQDTESIIRAAHQKIDSTSRELIGTFKEESSYALSID